MTDLIYPLGPQTPLPNDGGIVSAGIALQAASAAQSARDAAIVARNDVADLYGFYLGSHTTDAAAEAFAAGKSITILNGAMYRNTTSGVIRIRQAGAWANYVDPATISGAAAASAELASSKALDAQAASVVAVVARNSAEVYRNSAEQARDTATGAATTATAQAIIATAKASDAAADRVQTGLDLAQTGSDKTAAQTARTGAETARDAAISAKDIAVAKASETAGYRDTVATTNSSLLAIFGSLQRQNLGPHPSDAAANAYALANGINPKPEGITYDNTTTNKLRAWRSGAWEDQDATVIFQNTAAAVSAANAAASASLAQSLKDSVDASKTLVDTATTTTLGYRDAAAASATLAGQKATDASGFASTATTKATEAAAALDAVTSSLAGFVTAVANLSTWQIQMAFDLNAHING